MDSLNSWLPAQLFTLAGLLLVVGVVLMFIWRAINRPQVGGAKGGRQSRLGVVDSYGVGTRQLVLVRRDNVEHLIMIGGPNDVVVESSILRARPAGQAARPAAPGATPPPVQERTAAIAVPPRQVEEDFARPEPVEPPPVAKIETPVPAPATTPVSRTSPAAATTPQVPSSTSATRPSVVPPREPGFFQRATSRLPNFGRPAATAAAPAPVAPAVPAAEEPRATIDTAHFEELLAGDPPATTPAPKPTVSAAPAAQTTAAPKPKAELDFEVAEGLDLEPAPETREPPAPTTTTRLTLPEIRLPDLRLPEWRRPEATPAPTPAPRQAPELRVEPRFSADPRPTGEPSPTLGGRIEPSLGTPAPRPQAEPTRTEPFRVGERLTTPTRPATTVPASSTTAAPAATAAPTPTAASTPTPPPAPTTTPAPAEAEDPFASLEEEMASLLGRNRDDSKKP
ncbi:hypothetical protein BA190_21970 [Labrys sp. WJW]|uniref:hypothetical protein n=1 Tax=Labrys sp. WJW TaxID=1737983 RepID=UPI00082DBD95|nr:hypothetical protein [Labrys sp. WJW]OCC02837.1 hypothetical protein BA190_21970 [Labrys sp. WJW]